MSRIYLHFKVNKASFSYGEEGTIHSEEFEAWMEDKHSPEVFRHGSSATAFLPHPSFGESGGCRNGNKEG
jgi:hypothetical protein